MKNGKLEYSTKRVTKTLLTEIIKAIKNIRYGSVELYIQDNEVTQITERNIKKTDNLKSESRVSNESRGSKENRGSQVTV